MIAVKNMDMPQSCSRCNFNDDCGLCCVDEHYRDIIEYMENRPEWCPLRPIVQIKTETLFPEDDIDKYGLDEIKGCFNYHIKNKIANEIMNNPGLIIYKEHDNPVAKSMNDICIRGYIGVVKFKEDEMEDTEKWIDRKGRIE